MRGPGRPLSSEQVVLQLRIIAFALLASAIVITGVGYAVTLSRELAAGGGAATALFAIWVAAAIGATAGWWVLSRHAISGARGPGAHGAIAAGPVQPQRIAARLIAAYALLEAQLMVAFVASFLQGTPFLLVPALGIMVLGILLSFPRREWFVPFERGR